jgi:hypothetical protein
MDIESKQAAKLLETIAGINECFIDFSQSLRSRSEVLSVKHSLECRKSDSTVMLECYSDAELHSGKAICWWLEVQQNEEQWVLETSVLINDGQGQSVIREFPNRVSTTIDELIAQLEEATFELLSSIASIDLKM